jgi:hypothetical protein
LIESVRSEPQRVIAVRPLTGSEFTLAPPVRLKTL